MDVFDHPWYGNGGHPKHFQFGMQRMRSEKPKIPKLPTWVHGSTSNLANRTQKETAVGTPQQKKCEKMFAMLCLDDLDGYNSIKRVKAPRMCI